MVTKMAKWKKADLIPNTAQYLVDGCIHSDTLPIQY